MVQEVIIIEGKEFLKKSTKVNLKLADTNIKKNIKNTAVAGKGTLFRNYTYFP